VSGAAAGTGAMQATAFTGQRLAAPQATAARQQRQQLQVVAKDSRIGKRPIPLPEKVTVELSGQDVKVKVRFSAAGITWMTCTPLGHAASDSAWQCGGPTAAAAAPCVRR
jgi:hypothetical protein